MPNIARTINAYLKYPLMWVMLLWAITLPGHEVIVYDFLLKVISGAPAGTLANSRDAISRAEAQKITSHVYLEAAPATFAGKLVSQPVHFIPGVFSLFVKLPNRFDSLPFISSPNRALHKGLLIAVLPNAP
ncbi:hypothetical protein [Pontibacter fetidus]|uniref:Uncharacterized protein n=1 Tax=Pontibacter fetidus TaxID=2700082 RepID=A0A6B2H4K5_9BACT|nr:hypothetical protein [Pontibacter fetidus]NDK57391.1 hypothetical protein [Pontibacter fetidus]